MDIGEMRVDEDKIQLVQNRVHWPDLVNMVLNHRVS
jgi:hypothetical protein